jgi:glycosyltransferase involved in cell wall biosynthesis
MTEVAPCPFAVVVCTRNRSEQLARTLVSLADQSWLGFEVMVVDQSDPPRP